MKITVNEIDKEKELPREYPYFGAQYFKDGRISHVAMFLKNSTAIMVYKHNCAVFGSLGKVYNGFIHEKLWTPIEYSVTFSTEK